MHENRLFLRALLRALIAERPDAQGLYIPRGGRTTRWPARSKRSAGLQARACPGNELRAIRCPAHRR